MFDWFSLPFIQTHTSHLQPNSHWKRLAAPCKYLPAQRAKHQVKCLLIGQSPAVNFMEAFPRTEQSPPPPFSLSAFTAVVVAVGR